MAEADMDTNEIQKEENKIRFNLDVNEDFISNRLSPADLKELILHYPFPSEKVKELSSFEEKKTPAELFHEIVRTIHSMESNHERSTKYKDLADAFWEMHNEKVYNILTGREFPDDTHDKLLHKCGPAFCEMLDVEYILPNLVAEEVINDTNTQIICQSLQTKGSWSAAFELLKCLPNTNSNWFEIFMEILQDKQPDLGKILNKEHEKVRNKVRNVGTEKYATTMSEDRSLLGNDPPARMNQLSLNDAVPRFELSGHSQTTMADRSDRPEDRSLVGIGPPARMNQLSLNDAVPRFELSGHSQTTMADRSDRPDIVRQTYSMYAHDGSYWGKCAHDKMEDGHTGKPTIALISDFKPTETMRYAGPDIQDGTTKDEAIDNVLYFTEKTKLEIREVPIGDVDQGILDLLCDVTTGERLANSHGRELIRKGLEMEDMFRITDKLLVDFNSELGRGATSNVYKGKFENIPVAVKRINCKDKTVAECTVMTFRNSRETKLMNILETERHNNIVGYYVSEYRETFMYIAMELCHGTLADYVVNEDLKAMYPSVKVNQDITSGVDFLHSNNIAHRDLKPHNIYFITKGTRLSKFVIGDFGTSKITVNDTCSMSTYVGTSGYIAPEVWKEIISSNETNPPRTMNLSSDIFALGCVIFYTVSNGEHPYGKGAIRQQNIHQNEPPCVEKLDPWRDPIKQLVVMMLHKDPKKRPTSREVNDHPALWSGERTMNFLAEAGARLQNADDVTKCNMEDPNVQLNGIWAANLPSKLKRYLDTRVVGKRYIYRELRNSVYGLLRTIRNVETHYKEFPLEVQSELGQYPEGHAEFWMRVCPTLLMHVFRKVRELQIPGMSHQ